MTKFYTLGEEIADSITRGIGTALAVAALSVLSDLRKACRDLAAFIN